MTYKLSYIAYSDDQELKSRSISILNGFFEDQNYEIQEEASTIIFVASGGSEQNAAEMPSVPDHLK